MRFEISALFGMEAGPLPVVEQYIGDGIWIQDVITNGVLTGLFEGVRQINESAYRAFVARKDSEDFDYSHRLYVEFDAESRASPEFAKRQQQIMHAIILTRIIKPIRTPLHPTTVLTSNGAFEVAITYGYYGSAGVHGRDDLEYISAEHAVTISNYWDRWQEIFENRKTKYRRLHRAIMAYANSWHIHPVEINHVVIHSAIETLICADRRNNRAQVTQRLPQLVDGLISERQAVEAYEFCCGVKHAAEPALLLSTTWQEMHPDDEKRIDSARALDDSLRYIFRKAMDDPSFASVLEDKKQLALLYPIRR